MEPGSHPRSHSRGQSTGPIDLNLPPAENIAEEAISLMPHTSPPLPQPALTLNMNGCPAAHNNLRQTNTSLPFIGEKQPDHQWDHTFAQSISIPAHAAVTNTHRASLPPNLILSLQPLSFLHHNPNPLLTTLTHNPIPLPSTPTHPSSSIPSASTLSRSLPTQMVVPQANHTPKPFCYLHHHHHHNPTLYLHTLLPPFVSLTQTLSSSPLTQLSHLSQLSPWLVHTREGWVSLQAGRHPVPYRGTKGGD